MNEFQEIQNIISSMNINTNILTWAVLIGIMVDFITGIAKGYKTGQKISSSKLRDGSFKKAGIILVILLSYELSLLFNDNHRIIFNGVQLYYFYMETVSIMENLIEIGVDVPWVLRKALGDKKSELLNGEDNER